MYFMRIAISVTIKYHKRQDQIVMTVNGMAIYSRMIFAQEKGVRARHILANITTWQRQLKVLDGTIVYHFYSLSPLSHALNYKGVISDQFISFHQISHVIKRNKWVMA